jgi:hypothetical protein
MGKYVKANSKEDNKDNKNIKHPSNFEKKKKKLLRKAMELSMLYKKEILLSIMEDDKMALYSSSKLSSERFKTKLMNPNVQKEVLSNGDVKFNF